MEFVSDSEGTLYTVLLQDIPIKTESTDSSKTIPSMLISNKLKTAGISLMKMISEKVLFPIIHKTAHITEVGNCCINTTRDFCIKCATCIVQIEKSISQCKDTDILATEDCTSCFVSMENYYTQENKTCKLYQSFKRFFMLHFSISNLNYTWCYLGLCHEVGKIRLKTPLLRFLYRNLCCIQHRYLSDLYICWFEVGSSIWSTTNLIMNKRQILYGLHNKNKIPYYKSKNLLSFKIK
jgi:hypothetical protein